MSNELVDFWKRYRVDRPPFAHPDDIDLLRDNGRLVESDASDFKSYIAGRRFASREDNELHLSLLPVPYIGNVQESKIVILLLNPGFEHSDYWAEYHQPEFRKRIEQNLSQSFDGIDYPFLYLDPQFCWHSGFRWWERKLREVILRIAVIKFNGDYREALRDLSQKLSCVELFPYHSASFRDHGLIAKLPSCIAAYSFVKNSIRSETDANRRLWIATRKVREWGVEKSNTVKVYSGGQTRGASLGVASEGGKAILDWYGIR